MSAQPAEPATTLPDPMDGDHPGEHLVEFLEQDQLVTETFKPVPKANLSPAAIAALWALRVFAVTVSAMVLYTFIVQLH
jgi:hypothetical protein